MRIAFISYDFGEYCVQHANGLLDHGEVLLVMPAELFNPYEEMLDSQVELQTFPKPRLRQAIKQVRTMRSILNHIKKFRPDVIHFQLGHMWFNFALPLLRRKYPVVFTVHDPRHHVGDRGSRNTPQWIMDFGYRRADKVIVHGAPLKKIMCDEVKIPAGDVHVIPHIAIGERETQPLDADENSILFFGRIWPYKGLEYLIRAQPLINREFPSAKFLVCGRGEDMEYYRNMMADPDRFEVHNRWITDQERADFFEQSSVVVLPYIEATQSGVVPIAYAHSKPVVATRTGGLPDVIDEGKTGLLVEPKDEVGLANAVISLLRDKQLRQSMGVAGNLKLQAELAPNVVCRQTAEVYRLAIEARNQKNDPNKIEVAKSSIA